MRARFFVVLFSLSVLGRAHHPESADSSWIELFDGKTLNGWTPKIVGYPAGENFGRTFRVVDGKIQVNYGSYAGFKGRFGHLFYKTKFSRYIFQCQYRFTGEQVFDGPGWAYRNSGVMVHGQTPESMRLDQDFPCSIEVQLLGGDGSGERHTGNLCTPGTNVEFDGKLVTRHCTDSTSKTYDNDQWVNLEIIVDGSKSIVHRINGETVLSYNAPQLDPNDPDGKRLMETQPKLLSEGTISLQSESHPCEFRNIRIKPL